MSIFKQVKMQKPPYNTFDLSHDRKFSTQFSQLTPILCMDLVPGDSISMSSSQMIRFAPMLAPVMHQVNVYTHFFFVPNRLVWANWEDFITGGEEGSTPPVAPYIDVLGTPKTLADYLGLPADNGGSTAFRVSAIPFAAYQLIYKDYFRDENLQLLASGWTVDTDLVNGTNAATAAGLTTMRNRAWQHDYFTSALPWTQKGPEATIPLGTTADLNFVPGNNPAIAKEGVTSTVSPAGALDISATGGQLFTTGGNFQQIDNSASLAVDLTTATAATINELRNAFRLQEWLEKNARGGTRYTESILAHFGVKSPDSRLQRPEFLGGGSAPVTISEVLQTGTPSNFGGASGETALGTMSGHGIAVGSSNNFKYYAQEHGYVIGLMSIMPRPAYQQGIPRHWRKFDKLDFYWPSFANLGEQPIFNYELYQDTADVTNADTFGYTPRYAEYKYMPSTVHGAYRTTLDYWHLGRKFANRPQLNGTFLQVDTTEMGRIFAVPTSDEQMYCHSYHRIKAKRPMPFFGTPKGI